MSATDWNQKLVAYLEGSLPSAAFWREFAEWAVYRNGGDGVAVARLEEACGDMLAAADYEDEVRAVMGLDPAYFHELPPDLQEEFLAAAGADRPGGSSSVLSLPPDPLLDDDTLLVHFTDEPDAIQREGFRRGVRDFAHLGETVRLPEWVKEEGGFNFAYLADQADYSIQAGAFRRRWAVLFHHGGVRVHHHGDREPQVVFWGPDVAPSAIVAVLPAEEWRARRELPSGADGPRP
jgi:hypothetical protein